MISQIKGVDLLPCHSCLDTRVTSSVTINIFIHKCLAMHPPNSDSEWKGRQDIYLHTMGMAHDSTFIILALALALALSLVFSY